MDARVKRHRDAALAVFDKAKAENRKPTRDEVKEAEGHVESAREALADAELREQIDRIQGRRGPVSTESGGFAKAVLDAGFDLKGSPAVEIQSRKIFAASTLPSPDTWRVTEPTIAPLGHRRQVLAHDSLLFLFRASAPC